MVPTGIVLWAKTSPPTSATSPKIIYSSMRARSQSYFIKLDDPIIDFE